VRLDDIVPFAVELVGININLLHFFGCNLASGWILAAIQPARYRQPFCCGRFGNEIHDGFVIPQWLPPPIGRDEGKQSMLDLVPFAGCWREMTDGKV